MTDGHRSTIDLSDEDSAFVEERVASGAFRSEADVVHAGLSALREKEEGFDRWIREEVVPVYDRVMADSSCLIPADEAFARLRARYADDQ